MKDYNLDVPLFQDDLINWYKQVKRDLPWRYNQDPYRIWISEIMLQQTQVNTVIPYFETFMKQFPTIEDLACADEELLLKAWEGLGYYSRIRNIHTTAKRIQSEFNGVFPRDYETILSLKGIGSYTAGAISSIAFDQPTPAVDGNVMRVMSRVLGIWDDIANPKTKKKFESILTDVVSTKDPSSFNQGLMELGALICKPKGQICTECPVNEHCIAYHNGYDDQLPVKISKTKQRKVPLITGVIQNEVGAYLMRKRPSEGLLANMWEFVQVEGTDIHDLQDYLLYHYDIKLGEHMRLGETKHVFSHLIWYMDVYKTSVTSYLELPDHLRFISRNDLENVPIATAHKKIFLFIDE